MIAAGPQAWLNRRLLSNPGAVWLGKISYPLYLWHWPALVFARIISPTFPVGAIVAGSVVAAALTYQLVEKPIRFGTAFKGAPRWLAAAMATVFLGAVVVNQLNGVPSRIKGGAAAELQQDLRFDVPKHLECPEALTRDKPELKYCSRTAETPVAAIFGDSHGDTLFEGVAGVDTGRGWLLVGNPSCPPIVGVDTFSDEANCQARMRKAMDYLAAHEEIRTVVLVFYGNYLAADDYAADHKRYHNGPAEIRLQSSEHPGMTKAALFKLGLDETVGELIRMQRRVALVIDVPELPFWPQDCIPRLETDKPPDCRLPADGVMKRQAQLRQIVAELEEKYPPLRVFDTSPLLCDDQVCDVQRGHMLLYRDSNHLSLRGSTYVAEALVKWL
jgi:hypothetical protein